MDFYDELPEDSSEIGSDELLADDNLELPEEANTSMRLHAVRAWLMRRQNEMVIEIGEAALALQYIQMEEPQETRLRRREQQALMERLQQAQQAFQQAQQRLETYEEAQALLEECVAHTTSSERMLVEYYLTLEELVQDSAENTHTGKSPRQAVLAEVLHRVEQVGAPDEQE